MKKQLLLAATIAGVSGTMLAQTATWNAFTSGAYRNGPIGINNSSPNYVLDINTEYSGDGIRIQHNNSVYTDGAWFVMNVFNNSAPRTFGFTAGGNGSSIGTGNFALLDMTANASRMFVQGTTGKIGFGTNSPNNKIDILTNSATNDGLSITNSGSGEASLSLYNSFFGGSTSRKWSLNTQSSGDFALREEISGYEALHINYSSGQPFIGLGSAPGASARVTIDNTTPNMQSASVSYKGAGSGVGLIGTAECSNTSLTGTHAMGIRGLGKGARNNYGGYFEGICNVGCPGGGNTYGVYATLLTGPTPCAGDYAGYFGGDVCISGAGIVNGMAMVSDQKLKKDIKPLSNSLDKIRQLKPSTYTFKVDEFKSMNLPKEQQIGLIAQELEQVLPELVMNVEKNEQYDDKGTVIQSVPEHKAVNYIGLIPVLIAAVKEQDKTIQQQQQMIDALMSKQSNATGIDQMSNPMSGFALAQNIPNPFSSETVINYTLPEQVKNASLMVYDLTGKQIASFALNQKGSASITITSEKLSAGIYIYSVVADGKILDSKRMVVAEK